MAKRKYLDRIEELFEKSVVVSLSDIERIIKDKKDTEYAKQIVNHLVKKGKIKRLTQGWYTVNNEVGIGVLCFKPAYLGLESALSYYNLWEQETTPVIITSNLIRPGIRKCMEKNILIRRSSKKYMFGYELKEDAGYYLPYSDIEKTFIDFIVFREKLSSEVIKEFKHRIEAKKLERYLRKYPKRVKIKVKNALK